MEFTKLQEMMAECFGIASERITMETNFKDDLGLDSLDIMQFVVEVENELGVTIPDEALESIATVKDAYEAIQNL